jgi:hypothetical protein
VSGLGQKVNDAHSLAHIFICIIHTQDEQEKKRLQQLEKKAEAKALLEKEMASIKVSSSKQPISKITRADIVATAEKRNQVTLKKKEKEQPIEENLNRVTLEGEVAETVDEAISILR